MGWGIQGVGVDLSADFAAVAGGQRHSLGLRADGSIVAWGLNDDGQCDVPEANTDFVAVAAGDYHSLGLKADGSIVAWGDSEVSSQEFDGPHRRFRNLDRNQDGVIDTQEAASRPGRQRPGREEGPGEPLSPRPRPQANLEVLTVGTGSPLYNPDRSGPCTLIRNASQHVLVDTGEGTSRHLREAEIALGSIAAFCFAHDHRDHNDDAMTILPQAWLRGVAVPVIGPTGTRPLCDFLWSFYEEDMQYRAGNRGASRRPSRAPR